MRQSLSLALHAAGLVVIYSIYGILQEKIMKGEYNGERFTSAPILVLCNRVFSTCVGLTIALGQAAFTKKSSDPLSTSKPASLFATLKPASPIYAYAAVALLNFLSTFCQYEALRYVGFTSQALAKCAKMVPVLIIGRLVYKKTHSGKQWIAAWVVILGIATYLFSRPNVDAVKGDGDWLAGVIGTILLLGYLGFDGLTSTTQEKVFGKNPNSANPFGPESPVLDQMIFVNAFAALIAVFGTLASFTTVGPAMRLMATSPALVLDIVLLSATSAFGLIVLLNTIAAFGALTCSTVMTCRQFFSILLNAGIFGNFASMGAGGLLGVMWVFSGIYIKMNRTWDPPKKTALKLTESTDALHSSPTTNTYEDDQSSDKESLLGSPIQEKSRDYEIPEAVAAPRRSPISYFFQYGIPVALPLFIAGIAGLFMAGLHVSISLGDYIEATESPELSALALDIPSANTAAGAMLQEEAAEDVELEAGLWGSQLHALTNVQCPTGAVNTTFYPDSIPVTALATYPRSGNSYIRGLIERATTYRTSSVYCDKVLAQTFVGECTNDPFLRKTHYPSTRVKDIYINDDTHWKQFDRAIHLIRNPLDEVYSFWNYRQTHSHTGRVEGVEKLGATSQQRSQVLRIAEGYVSHNAYWQSAPLLKHEVRYEDLRSAPIPQMMSLLNFLLHGTGRLPSLEQLACVVEVNEEAEAYHSRKSTVFSSWDKYDEGVRQEVLEIVKPVWCQFGYDKLFEQTMDLKPIDCRQ